MEQQHQHVVTLNNGATIPVMGLGTWQSKPDEVKHAVKEAIRVGYRHLDCAAIYGNEEEVGDAIQECIQEGLISSRDELFVTSKLWNDQKSKEDVIPALRETLLKLKIKYLDMYLIHWPVCLKKGFSWVDLNADNFLKESDVPLKETWEQLELAVQQGLTKGIGLSNFSPKKIQGLFDDYPEIQVKPAVNQVELHPYLKRREIMDFCRQHNIHVTAYSPLGSSPRPGDGRPDDFVPPLENPDILAIAKKHNCTPAQVLLRWSIQYGCSVVPKSVTPERIQENFGALQVQLDDEDMQTIAKLDQGWRAVDGKFWCIEGSPYTLETLWDSA